MVSVCSALSCPFVHAEDVVVSVPAVADKPAALPEANPLVIAMKVRSEMAARIMNGTEKPPEALIRLRTLDSPSGLAIDPDASLAYAARDIGNRLLSAGKRVEAEEFFRESEKALTTVIDRTPAQSSRERADLLSSRARLRAEYLNEAIAARADIDEAIQLVPDDAALKQLRAVLASSRSEFFKDSAGK
ncbi:MAG: hypothetical protein JWM88_2551 [Verrucomicrobia bacterium]|nr:hypothetical protein [Verrucomicrobiota bacterium]